MTWRRTHPMDPQAIQQLLNNPALSLGLALALAVPLGGAGFALWFWGKRSLKAVSFVVSGVMGLLLGLIVGGLLGGRLEVIACAIVGLVAGATLGLAAFRFMVACMSGMAVFFLSVGIGASLIGGGGTQQGAAQSTSGGGSGASAMQVLQQFATSKFNAGVPAESSSIEATQPDLAALARDAVSKANATKDRPKEYVDVRNLKKEPSRLQVEQTKDAAGKTKLVIKDEHYAKIDTTPVGPHDIASGSQEKAATQGATDNAAPATSALADDTKSSGKINDEQAAQLESLMNSGGLGGLVNGAAATGSLQDLKSLFAVLGIATFLGMCAFGVAMWLHRHAVAVLSSGLGAGLMVSSAKLIMHGALGASAAPIIDGTLGTVVSAVIWIALMSLGTWLQLKRKPVVVLEQPALHGRLPARASGGEAVSASPSAAQAPAAPVEEKKPRKKAA